MLPSPLLDLVTVSISTSFYSHLAPSLLLMFALPLTHSFHRSTHGHRRRLSQPRDRPLSRRIQIDRSRNSHRHPRRRQHLYRTRPNRLLRRNHEVRWRCLLRSGDRNSDWACCCRDIGSWLVDKGIKWWQCNHDGCSWWSCMYGCEVWAVWRDWLYGLYDLCFWLYLLRCFATLLLPVCVSRDFVKPVG